MSKNKIKTQYTKADIAKINNAYFTKVEEYSKLSLEELKELYPTLGGSYKIACLEVTKEKLQELKQQNLKSAIDDVKNNIEEAIIIDEQSNIETND